MTNKGIMKKYLSFKTKYLCTTVKLHIFAIVL